MDDRAQAAAIHAAALAAVDARRAVARTLRTLDLVGPIHVLGAGKAAAAMAQGARDVLGARIVSGLVVVKDGHTLPLPGIDVREAGHPVADARSLAAGHALWSAAGAMPAGSVVLGLWSGGASALAEVLKPGVTLDQLVAEVAELGRQGAPITRINAHRRARSRLKGGGLARNSAAQFVNLVISDVPGDDPALVGSGPAIAPGTEEHVVATLDDAVAGARGAAEALGWPVTVLDGHRHGRAEPVGEELAREVARRSGCVLGAGEPVVHLGPRPGRGGRMQQAALAAAIALRTPATLWFAGTDGTDGPTDAAGACVDHHTAARIRAAGLDPERHLREHDAYPALDAAGALVRTGPTRTNVRDLWFGLVRSEAP